MLTVGSFGYAVAAALVLGEGDELEASALIGLQIALFEAGQWHVLCVCMCSLQHGQKPLKASLWLCRASSCTPHTTPECPKAAPMGALVGRRHLSQTGVSGSPHSV
jgi:hypothetical protein